MTGIAQAERKYFKPLITEKPSLQTLPSLLWERKAADYSSFKGNEYILF